MSTVKRRNSRSFGSLLAGLAVISLVAAPGAAYGAEARGVSGTSRGVAASGDLLNMGATPRVKLPRSGGERTDSVGSMDEEGVSTGDVSVGTTGSLAEGSSSAIATVMDLAIGAEIDGASVELITASSLEAVSDSACRVGRPESSREATVTNLEVLGQSIAVTGKPNQTVSVDLPGSAGTLSLVLNEQRPREERATVTALRALLSMGGTVQEVSVAAAESGVACGRGGTGGDQQGGDQQGDDGQGESPQTGDQQDGDGQEEEDALPKTGGDPAAAGTSPVVPLALACLALFLVRDRLPGVRPRVARR